MRHPKGKGSNMSMSRMRNSYWDKAKQIKKGKAKIKQNFFKALEKKGEILEPPAFYHEIFDFDDIKVEKALSTKIVEEEERINYQEDKRNKELSLGINRKVKEINKSRKSVKPNPFYKVLQERERIQREKCVEKEAIRQERQLYKQKREAYSIRRNKTKKKLMKRNSKGQPVMKSQIDHILSKIREQKLLYSAQQEVTGHL